MVVVEKLQDLFARVILAFVWPTAKSVTGSTKRFFQEWWLQILLDAEEREGEWSATLEGWGQEKAADAAFKRAMSYKEKAAAFAVRHGLRRY